MLRSVRNSLVRQSLLLASRAFGDGQGGVSSWMKPTWPHTVWLAGYLGTVAVLQRFDPFDGDFDTSGPILFLYNWARVGFLAYFASILLGLGLLILGPLEKGRLPRFGYLDRLLLGFWLGAAVLTLIMFPLGYLNLYYRLTALILTIPILYFAFSPLMDFLAEGKQQAANLHRRFLADKFASLPFIITGGGILSFLLILLLTRGIYPGETTNDVYEHYWPYQRAVIQSHGIWPNDVWYDYYAAKGFGLNYLAMLLTDDLAPQSVTFLFLAASAALVFAVTRKLTGGNYWAILSAVACLGAFPFPLSVPLRWGGFQSHHLPATAWVACLTWMAIMTLDDPRLNRGAWFVIWLILASGFTVFFPPFCVFTLPLIIILAGLLWLTNQRIAARSCLWVLGGVALLLAGLSLVNHVVTGMVNDNPKRVAWAFADQERFGRWCSPYLVVLFNEVSEEYEGKINVPRFVDRSVKHFEELTRIQYLGCYYPGHLGAAILALAAAVRWIAWLDSARTRVSQVIFVAAAFVMAMVIEEVLKLDASVYRNYVFLLVYQCVLLSLGWKLALSWAPRRLSAMVSLVFALAVVATAHIDAIHRLDASLGTGRKGKRTDYLRFALGRISVQKALTRGDGLWKEATEAKKLVGFNTPILCLSGVNFELPGLASYSFPGNGFLTEPSRTSFRGQWHVVAFEDPASARRALAEQGINYFLIDPSKDLIGCIPFGPLFEPEGLAERFEVVNSWGNLYLLTWSNSTGQRLPSQFVKQLANRVATLRKDQLPRYRLSKILAAYYQFNKGEGYPLKRPPNLPRLIRTSR